MDYLITMDEFQDSDKLRVSQIRKAIRSARPVYQIQLDGMECHSGYNDDNRPVTMYACIKENQP
jgi:hypothetical protein